MTLLLSNYRNLVDFKVLRAISMITRPTRVVSARLPSLFWTISGSALRSRFQTRRLSLSTFITPHWFEIINHYHCVRFAKYVWMDCLFEIGRKDGWNDDNNVFHSAFSFPLCSRADTILRNRCLKYFPVSAHVLQLWFFVPLRLQLILMSLVGWLDETASVCYQSSFGYSPVRKISSA